MAGSVAAMVRSFVGSEPKTAAALERALRAAEDDLKLARQQMDTAVNMWPAPSNDRGWIASNRPMTSPNDTAPSYHDPEGAALRKRFAAYDAALEREQAAERAVRAAETALATAREEERLQALGDGRKALRAAIEAEAAAKEAVVIAEKAHTRAAVLLREANAKQVEADAAYAAASTSHASAVVEFARGQATSVPDIMRDVRINMQSAADAVNAGRAAVEMLDRDVADRKRDLEKATVTRESAVAFVVSRNYASALVADYRAARDKYVALARLASVALNAMRPGTECLERKELAAILARPLDAFDGQDRFVDPFMAWVNALASDPDARAPKRGA